MSKKDTFKGLVPVDVVDMRKFVKFEKSFLDYQNNRLFELFFEEFYKNLYSFKRIGIFRKKKIKPSREEAIKCFSEPGNSGFLPFGYILYSKHMSEYKDIMHDFRDFAEIAQPHHPIYLSPNYAKVFNDLKKFATTQMGM